MRRKLLILAESILAIVFPRRCAICDRTIEKNRNICRCCETKVKLIDGPSCLKCGKLVREEGQLYCYDCSRTIKNFDRGFAVFEYQYINNSIYKFKYSNRPEYSRFYAEKAVILYGELLRQLGVEILIPVPIHMKRQRKRGYNQSLEFARAISKLTGIAVDDSLVIRCINTVPLKKLGAQQRQKNLKKAFKLTRNDVKFRRVCIVDDIYTTGATIDAIALLLKQRGVSKVYFVTVAIGTGI